MTSFRRSRASPSKRRCSFHPHGTGCSRYVATVVTEDGIFANWQQSQPDLSQPLVGHFLSMEKVTEILAM